MIHCVRTFTKDSWRNMSNEIQSAGYPTILDVQGFLWKEYEPGRPFEEHCKNLGL